jgi:Terminase large subunit, T4likevirus-type, N-terminal
VIEASTKSGKTVGCMVWLTEQAWLGKSGWEFWWVAPIYEQARIVFRRLKQGLTPNTFTANEKDSAITLANGAVLRFKGADNPDSLYGEDVHAAVIDEATRVKEDAWFAVRSTLTATRGKVRIIGNVKGRRNWAYRLARRAESGEPDMHYARITAYDAIQAGVLNAAEIDDARAQLPEHVFRELYEAEPSDDEGNPFGINAIRSCLEPLHRDCDPVCWGWDLARANDWTWGIGLCEHGAVAHSERWNQTQYPTLDAGAEDGSSHPEFWEVTIRRIRDLVGGTPAAVDSTGPGGPIDQALNGRKNFEGYVFNQRSKQLLMEGLAVGIQQHQVAFPEGPLTVELEAFEYVYSRTGVHYSAPEGMHDDGVCALALAWYRFGQLRKLDMVKLLLSQPTGVRYHGALSGGRQRERDGNPLN